MCGMSERCYICCSPDVVYTDILGLNWCRTDYNDIYLGGE